MSNSSLPIDAVLPQLKRALAEHDAAVLQAPPGAGKTTRVPLAFLDESWLSGKSILMLEPRRLAATNAARFMASCLGEDVGKTVGYAIRYDRRVSQKTRIEVVTEGILTRRLQADPTLEGIGLVIFDEFHERSIHSDLALALCRDAQLGLREDLKLLVMSASLDGEPVADILGGAPVVASEGRSYPVEINYLHRQPEGRIAEYTAAAVHQALRQTDGDILVFLPGTGEIRTCLKLLEDAPACGDVCFRPLYGDLPFAEQERAILPGKQRRVVLATNIAETSLTIEGVSVVVDSGFARQPRFDSGRGVVRLDTVRISAASAEQRAGRAGRLKKGICYRLWTKGVQGSLLPFSPPEIRSADLSSLVLELARWGIYDTKSLVWLDEPPSGAMAVARDLLFCLGALDDNGRITPLGEEMASIAAHPRLARLLIEAQRVGIGQLGCDLVALLSERDIFRKDKSPSHKSESDILDRLEAFWRWRKDDAGGGRYTALEQAARFWYRQLGLKRERGCKDIKPAHIGRLLAVAYPDRIAKERDAGSRRYLLSNGLGAGLHPSSSVNHEPLLVAVELSGVRAGEGFICQASALDLNDLRNIFPGRLRWQRKVFWDEREERVVAREEEFLGAIVLSTRPLKADDEEVAAALSGWIRKKGLDVLAWSKKDQELVSRVNFLRHTFPEDGWPDLSTEKLANTLEEWLAPYLIGVRSRADLERFDLYPILLGLLDWEQQRKLEKEAPTHISVPSGSRVRLEYEASGPPVLAVKLQELFGLADSPRIAGGRVDVMLHLLSPARRPIQVTRDLRSFWNDIYPEVKKELKGRYPKHPWPDDPWKAEPTRHVKRCKV